MPTEASDQRRKALEPTVGTTGKALRRCSGNLEIKGPAFSMNALSDKAARLVLSEISNGTANFQPPFGQEPEPKEGNGPATKSKSGQLLQPVNKAVAIFRHNVKFGLCQDAATPSRK